MCISRGLSLAILKQIYKYIVSKGYNIFPIQETEVSKQINSDISILHRLYTQQRTLLPFPSPSFNHARLNEETK